MRSECGLRAEVNELAILKWEKMDIMVFTADIKYRLGNPLEWQNVLAATSQADRFDMRRNMIVGESSKLEMITERREEGLQLNFPGDSLENKS